MSVPGVNTDQYRRIYNPIMPIASYEGTKAAAIQLFPVVQAAYLNGAMPVQTTFGDARSLKNTAQVNMDTAKLAAFDPFARFISYILPVKHSGYPGQQQHDERSKRQPLNYFA